jgi:hypothetical protein
VARNGCKAPRRMGASKEALSLGWDTVEPRARAANDADEVVTSRSGSRRSNMKSCGELEIETWRGRTGLIGVNPKGVARSSQIHKICGGEEDEHKELDEHDEHDTQIKGKLIGQRCPIFR